MTIAKNGPAVLCLFDVNPWLSKMKTIFLKRRAFRRDRWATPASFVSHPAHPPGFYRQGEPNLTGVIGRLDTKDEKKIRLLRRAAQMAEAAGSGVDGLEFRGQCLLLSIAVGLGFQSVQIKG
jgi:hypothetical protein